MLLNIFLLIVGLVVLVAGAEGLVRGAAAAARRLGLSPAFIGLTIVAYGTSMPELTVNLYAAFQGNLDIALGNVVGSNIANVALILGLTALVQPVSFAVRFVRWEIPLMVAISAGCVLLMLDGAISRLDAAVFLAAFVAYILTGYRRDRRENGSGDELAREELEAAGIDPDKLIAKPWYLDAALLVGGLLGLFLGTRMFIDGAVGIAEEMGVSQRVIGLTIVAIGTSLPELATSIVAAFRKHADIAVGNIIGSNLFNLLLVLGITASIFPFDVPPGVRSVDLPVMLVSSAVLIPMVYFGHRISRLEGGLLFGGYAAYTIYLYAAGSN